MVVLNLLLFDEYVIIVEDSEVFYWVYTGKACVS